MNQVRLGIVGLRNIGMGHVRTAAGLPNVEITALADTEEERLRTGLETAPDAETFTDAEALFDSDAVDGVVLAVPNFLHAPMSISAMKKGKHVLVEKPMAMNSQEADDMIAARDESGCILAIGMNQRFNELRAEAKAEIDKGTIGKIQYGRTRWNLNRPGAGLWGRGDWFLKGDSSGGAGLIDIGVHRLDLALYMMGFPEPESVLALNTYGIGKKMAAAHDMDFQLEDMTAAFIRFKNGSGLLLEASYFCNAKETWQNTVLMGEEGSLYINGEVEMFIFPEEEPLALELSPDENRSYSPVEHFCRVLREEEELIPTPEQGRTGLRIIEAAYESAKTGKQVIF